MFTGIIECLGRIENIESNGTNLTFTISSKITTELKIDQSLAHNGVCLTVDGFRDSNYTVTAIDETLQKSNLGQLSIGDYINLERCVLMNGRIDGHIVQGHVDTIATCEKIEDLNGSWKFYFTYNANSPDYITVAKGSICVNGTSLTVVDSGNNHFSVAIIPYTYENTQFKYLNIGDNVNLEFDIIGKYIARLMQKL